MRRMDIAARSAESSLEELLSAAAGALAPVKVAGGEFLVAVMPADSARVISVATGRLLAVVNAPLDDAGDGS